MDTILLLLLAGAIAWLWRRVDSLEQQIADLRAGLVLPSGVASEAARDQVVPVEESASAAPQPAVALPSAVGEIAEQSARWRPRFDFEDLFGRMLPIWAGGVTLAVAGFFLVRWSIDAGLLTPPVRVVLAGFFGIALIAGAEAAYRWRERVADPRVAQALAGAGLATLYAAFYLAGSAYGLIGSTFAFIGLAAVTGIAIALSYRFGLPSAVLGLVGGFAAPALVGSERANLPLLTLYLALVTAGLALAGRRQQRAWLGMAALGGGLGWGALLVSNGNFPTPDIAVLGAYLVFLGAILPALLGVEGRPRSIVRVGASALAALQLAVLVGQGGFGTLAWSLYLLLGAALAWFGWRQPAMREGSAVAAAIGVALLFLWPAPTASGFAVVAAGLAGIFAGVPLVQIWRGHARTVDFAQASGIAFGIALAALWHFGALIPAGPRPTMAVALLALACLPTLSLYLARFSPIAGREPWLLAAQSIAALLGYGALAQVLPADTLAWTAALLATLCAWRARALAGVVTTLAVIAGMWAMAPLYVWLEAGALALAGTAMKAASLPTARVVALRLIPAIVGGGAWYVSAPLASAARRAVGAAVMTAAVIAAHAVFRHAFAAAAGDDFVSTGVIERAAWELLLLGSAWSVLARDWRKVAIGLASAALAHFAWFSLVVHNPLGAEQAVGALPLANALLPAYAAGFLALALMGRLVADRPSLARWALDAAVMAVAALFALSELRQLFAGSQLSATPVGQDEDLLRSLLGIVLAIGFLTWGARTHERSWRIGSLVLMVIAVLKVFVIDAAGLAGLARIASFMALGFSLIGIGWFYSKQLRAPAPATGSPSAP